MSNTNILIHTPIFINQICRVLYSLIFTKTFLKITLFLRHSYLIKNLLILTYPQVSDTKNVSKLIGFERIQGGMPQ